jgi:hypothetical protein
MAKRTRATSATKKSSTKRQPATKPR